MTPFRFGSVQQPAGTINAPLGMMCIISATRPRINASAETMIVPVKMSKSTYAALLLLLLHTLLTALNAQDAFPKLCDVVDFNDFLQQTGKTYIDVLEYQYRESIFIAKKGVVDLANKQAQAGLATYDLAINPFADMTRTEVGRITGSRITTRGEEIASRHLNYVTSKVDSSTLPASFDWRDKGGVTPARFQGMKCGSCWSFATIGALEGHLFRRTGLLVPLSEQNLVDCCDAYGSTGCDGGFQEYAFEYARDNGVSLSNKYPYIMEHALCRRNQTGNGVRIRDYARIKPGDEDKMKEIIATLGPLACSMNGTPISFEQYKGGIYDDEECNKEEVNHAIVVVGYGSENGKDYWIIKNSYSENWGENGFMKLARNRNSFCGIATECSYPIL